MESKIDIHDEIYNFALRIAIAINDLKSSHVYFTMQKAFGEISWEEVEIILADITKKCSCKDCKKVKKEVINRFKGKL